MAVQTSENRTSNHLNSLILHFQPRARLITSPVEYFNHEDYPNEGQIERLARRLRLISHSDQLPPADKQIAMLKGLRGAIIVGEGGAVTTENGFVVVPNIEEGRAIVARRSDGRVTAAHFAGNAPVTEEDIAAVIRPHAQDTPDGSASRISIIVTGQPRHRQNEQSGSVWEMDSLSRIISEARSQNQPYTLVDQISNKTYRHLMPQILVASSAEDGLLWAGFPGNETIIEVLTSGQGEHRIRRF